MKRTIALTSVAALAIGLSTAEANANPALILVAPAAMHGIAAGTAAAIGLGAFGAGALLAGPIANGGWYGGGWGGCGYYGSGCAYGGPYAAPVVYGDDYVDGGYGYGGYGGYGYAPHVVHHYVHVATHCYRSWRAGIPVRVCVTPVY